MAKKAKRLVSESRTQLIDLVAGSFTLPYFRPAPAHFPQSPDHRPSIAAILFVLCEASSEGPGHNFAAGNAQAVISQRSISLEVDHACICIID
jgi:hypothetical protein